MITLDDLLNMDDGSGDCIILSNNHFNAIMCNVLLLSDVEKTAFIRNMVALNILAYNERYPREKVELSYGAKYFYQKPTESFTALQSLKFLDCLEFQLRSLRNHEDYPDFKRISAIKDQLIRLIDGYGALRWNLR